MNLGRIRRVGLGDVSIGMDRMAAAGEPVSVTPYPEGEPGIQQSIGLVCQKIRDGRIDTAVRGWAGDALIAAGSPTSVRGKAEAILNAVWAQTVYAPDPAGAEFIQSAATTLCLRPGLCIRAADCFPKGTLLLRDDYALVPIEEIKVGDRIWGLDKWTTVKRKMSKGVLSLDTLILNNGSHVPLTPDHHLYVGICDNEKCVAKSNWSTPIGCTCAWETRRIERIRVRDAKPGMMLPRPRRIPFGEGAPDPDIAYVDGLFLSEGWCNTNGSFAISGCDGFRKEALKHEVKAICDARKIPTNWHRKYITVKDPEWAARLADRGHRARFKNAETINLNEASAAALLRGIMSDSTQNSNGPGRTFSTTSTTLLVQTRVLQRMFGVGTGVRYMRPEQLTGFGKNPMWRMQVWSTNVEEKLLRIKDIERGTGEATCYDITTDTGYVYLPEHDATVSNCDDLVVVTGAALSSINIPIMVVRQFYGDGIQQHVLLAAQDEQGQWFYADPTARTRPVGWAASAEKESWYDPLEGVTGAVLVGVGNGNVGWFRHEAVAIVSVSDGSIGLGAIPRAGLAATPSSLPPTTTTWNPVNLSEIKSGGRYYFVISSDLEQGDLVAVLPDDWSNVESMTAGTTPQTWRIQAIAAHDGPPKTTTVTGPFGLVKGTIVYGTMLVEAAVGSPNPSAPAPAGDNPPPPPGDPNNPPPAPAGSALAPPAPSVEPPAQTVIDLKSALVGAGVLAVVGGVAWGYRRHVAKRRRSR